MQQLGALGDVGADALPGGADALATLVVAVLDGLTLSSLADDDGARRSEAAVALLLHLLEQAGDRVAPPGDGP